MILRRLDIANFKNIEEAHFDFAPKINCLLGDNGMGKSNLLDALYYLSFCKSFSGSKDAMLVRRGEQWSTLKGLYYRRGLDEEITAGIKPGARKSFRRGGKPYQRLAEHIGSFPLVLLSPADMDLVSGEPADRRRFLDQIISQADGAYLDTLMRYNTALEQRNRMLKDGVEDAILYQALEMQLEMTGSFIVQRRRETAETLAQILIPYYSAIAGNDEVPALEYSTADYSAEGGLAAHMDAVRRRDLALGYTSAGPHRDDVVFTINDMPVRRTASQGQSKTFTTALRFAQYELLSKRLCMRPLLLLDDIFDKLDAGRVERIMNIVGSSETFGQVFITDTNRRHLDEMIAIMPGTEHALWNVQGGTFTPMDV